MNKFKKTLAACLVAQFACGYAYAATDSDSTTSNDSFSQPQDLTSENSSGLSIKGAIGVVGGLANDDVDFYMIHARQGNVLTFAVNDGMGGAGSINAIIALYDMNGTLLSKSYIVNEDPHIDDYPMPADGRYIVGVTAYPRSFSDAGSGTQEILAFSWAPPPGGDYVLNITGSQDTSVEFINIDVKPGKRGVDAPLNPRSHGEIPVALLSSPSFKPMTVDISSLRFGSTGSENSLTKCNKSGADLNHDGELDLICHFATDKANFTNNSVEGFVSGKVNNAAGGREFKGHGPLKVKGHKKK